MLGLGARVVINVKKQLVVNAHLDIITVCGFFDIPASSYCREGQHGNIVDLAVSFNQKIGFALLAKGYP